MSVQLETTGSGRSARRAQRLPTCQKRGNAHLVEVRPKADAGAGLAAPVLHYRQERFGGLSADSTRREFCAHRIAADLVQLVQRHQRAHVQRLRNADVRQDGCEKLAMIQPHLEISKSQFQHYVGHGSAQFGLNDR